jgi:four helix bundle protein
MVEIRSFEDLECWKLCRDLRKTMNSYIVKFPKEEKYLLTDQLTRALRSTTNNIAEGYGRFHFQENIQFCRISRGSLFESIDHLIIAEEQGYINKNDFELLREKINRCLAVLNGYINYLKKAKSIN